MRGIEKSQGDFFSHRIYEMRIPADHILRCLKPLLDWRELASELDDYYRHKGRPAVLIRTRPGAGRTNTTRFWATSTT